MQNSCTTTNIGCHIGLELVGTYAQVFGCLIQRVSVFVVNQMHATIAVIAAWLAVMIAQTAFHITDSLEKRVWNSELLRRYIERLIYRSESTSRLSMRCVQTYYQLYNKC